MAETNEPAGDENRAPSGAPAKGSGGSFMLGCFVTIVVLFVLGFGWLYYQFEHIGWSKGRPLRGRKRRPWPEPDGRLPRAEAAAARRLRSAPLPGAGADLREYGVADATMRAGARARATAAAVAELPA